MFTEYFPRAKIIPKGNQSWIFTGRIDAEAEAPILWPPDVKSQLIRKDHDAGKDWRQKKKRAAGDEGVREHHWLNGQEFEQTQRDGGSSEEPGVQQSMGSQRVGHNFSAWTVGLPWWLSGKEFTCQFRRHEFDPWSRKIPPCGGKTKPMCHNYRIHVLEPGSGNY